MKPPSRPILNYFDRQSDLAKHRRASDAKRFFIGFSWMVAISIGAPITLGLLIELLLWLF